MPTLFRLGSYRVMVFFNDHHPPHKFELGATPNDVALVESDGIRTATLSQMQPR